MLLNTATQTARSQGNHSANEFEFKILELTLFTNHVNEYLRLELGRFCFSVVQADGHNAPADARQAVAPVVGVDRKVIETVADLLDFPCKTFVQPAGD